MPVNINTNNDNFYVWRDKITFTIHWVWLHIWRFQLRSRSQWREVCAAGGVGGVPGAGVHAPAPGTPPAIITTDAPRSWIIYSQICLSWLVGMSSNYGDNQYDHHPTTMMLKMVKGAVPGIPKPLIVGQSYRGIKRGYCLTLDRCFSQINITWLRLFISSVETFLFCVLVTSEWLAHSESRNRGNEHVREEKEAASFGTEGWLTDMRRRTRAQYHRAVELIKTNKELIILGTGLLIP